MKPENIYNILLAPHVSEKAAGQEQQYVFKVISSANKTAIKKAVETVFSVKVKNVRSLNKKGKPARHGRFVGRRKDWKKAYVTLMPGQQIQMAGE